MTASDRAPDGTPDGPTPRDERARALLAVRPDLRRATGLTGNEPEEGLHALLAERVSLLPPGERDRLWREIEAPGEQAPEPGAGSAAEAGTAPARAGEPDADGPGADAPPPPSSVPPADPAAGAAPALSPLDDRDYARAQALQFWHARIEPLVGLAARGAEAVESAERVLRDPDATPGEVRGKLGAVEEYRAVISRRWAELERVEIPEMVEGLRGMQLVGGAAEAARLEDLVGEIEGPRVLAEFRRRHEALERLEREHRAHERQQPADAPGPGRAPEPEYDDRGAAPAAAP